MRFPASSVHLCIRAAPSVSGPPVSFTCIGVGPQPLGLGFPNPHPHPGIPTQDTGGPETDGAAPAWEPHLWIISIHDVLITLFTLDDVGLMYSSVSVRPWY